MKKITLLILSFLTLNSFSQNFSGEIEYKYSIIPKEKSQYIDSIMELNKDVKINYLITDSFYKSTKYNEGEYVYSYTYDNISKRMYDDYADRAYITYRDSRKANYEYYGSTILKDSTEVISGLNCFLVKYDSEFGDSKSYYSDKIKVNYESFKDHKIGNWYEKLKEVDGSISIKNITEYEKYAEVRKAVKITEKPLGSNYFELPKDKIIVASYPALDKKVELIQPTKEQIELYQRQIKKASENLNDGENYICYLSFVLTKKGEVKYVEAYKEGSSYFDEKAVEIFTACNFDFSPGVIDGRKVSSQTYFPIEFKR